MANVAMMAISWTAVILRSLPEIIKAGHELYSLWCSIRDKHHGNEAVVKSMKLLNRYQDDIGRLLQDPQQKRDLLEGLTILMNRINESNGNNNTGSPRASGRNTTSSGGGDCGASFPSKSFKGARWMECDVCREDYTTTTTKRPLILHCGHTFCRECVEVLARRGLIRCPTCRTCEMRSLASIPTNTVMISMLEDWGNQGDNDSCNGMSKGKSSCTGDRGSGNGSGCDSISLSYEDQIQFAIFQSKQEAEAQGEAQVERRWREVEEVADMMLAEALQVSEMYEASRLCAERHQAPSAPGSLDLPEEEKESCASGSGSAEDEDASVLLAYKLQQEEIAMMQRLCGNASNDWSKEMNCFFGPSLCGMGEDGNSFRGRDNTTNGREQDSGEDGTTCCRGMENEDNDDGGGAACYRRGDDGEDEVMCCGREEEEEGGKKCSNSDEDDDLKKCCGDSCKEEECDKRFLELMKSEEALLVEMALQLSLHYPQPSDSEDK